MNKNMILVKSISFIFVIWLMNGFYLFYSFSFWLLLFFCCEILFLWLALKKLTCCYVFVIDEIKHMQIKLWKNLSIAITVAIGLFVMSFVLALNYYVYFYSYLKWTAYHHLRVPYFLLTGFGLYFVIKNSLLLYCCQKVNGHMYQNYFGKIKQLLICSGIYWLLVIIIQIIYFFFFEQTYIIKFMLCAIPVYMLVMFYIIYWQYKKIFSLKKLFKNILLMVSICALSLYMIMTADYWYLQPYINSIPSVKKYENNITENEDGSYTIQMSQDTFKILQLTDIHLGGSLYTIGEDKNALHAVYDLIEYTRPDLVVITGDFVFSIGLFSLSFNNYAPIEQFCSFMRHIGIPWTFVYGNHDTETVSTASFKKIDHLFQKFAQTNDHTLLYSQKRPHITGRYNQYIMIKNKDDTINQILFLLDSNQYIGHMTDYDYIHDDQLKWYEQTLLSFDSGNIPDSMIFFHMPIEEYQTAYKLYKQKSKEVKYYFGTIGEKKEAISTSKYESQLFETAKRLGSTKAMFAGHDHYNHISLEYEGIRLTFGRSIDYLAMPGIQQHSSQRGGTLITLNSDHSFEIDSIPLDAIRH